MNSKLQHPGFSLALILAISSLACTTITSLLTPGSEPPSLPPASTSAPPVLEEDWDKIRSNILDTLEGLETFQWSGTGEHSVSGPFKVVGRDSPGSYYEMDTYDDGYIGEYMRVEDTFCSRENKGEWNCSQSNSPTTMEILINSVKGLPVFPGFTVSDSSDSIETYKGAQYYAFYQRGTDDSSNASYTDTEYFDVGTFYPAHSVIEWTYPDYQLRYEYQYTDFNAPIEPIELPAP